MEISTLNLSPLAFWQAQGYREKDVEDSFSSMPSNGLSVLVRFSDGGYEYTATRDDDAVESRSKGLRAVLDGLVQRYEMVRQSEPGNPPLRGSLIFWLHDGYKRPTHYPAPLIAYSKLRQDSKTFLMPDADFVSYLGYRVHREKLDRACSNTPWETRTKKAIWRGASSGGELSVDTWRDNPRAQLCLAALTNDDIDAKITSVVQHDSPDVERLMGEAGVLGRAMPFNDFLNYRYQINIDGNSCAWSAFFLKLYSRSVVLKVDSDHVQWYYDSLVPWLHYIPVKNDLSNLDEQLRWAQEHDEAGKRIAENAFEAVSAITFESELARIIPLIPRVLACQHGPGSATHFQIQSSGVAPAAKPRL